VKLQIGKLICRRTSVFAPGIVSLKAGGLASRYNVDNVILARFAITREEACNREVRGKYFPSAAARGTLLGVARTYRNDRWLQSPQ